MLSPTLLHLTTTLLLATSALATNPFAQYANDFVDPDYVLSRLDQFASATSGAQDTVRAWADELASHGPWSVTFKPVVAPSGDKHDYMSWAPYQWPDCSKIRNRTELSPAQVRTTCPYVNRDGQVNPDRTIPNDFQSFFNLSDAVLYNSLASTFDSSGGDKAKYAGNAVKFLKTWFIDKDTAMNPNLNFAQMHLGPDGQKGTFTGILDLRMMAKLASGVLLLRTTKAPAWTSDLDSTFVSWCKAYIGWLQTAPSAKKALSAPNNHGTFAAGQMMALQILVGDTAGATSTGRAFFGGAFKGQIAADGDQPLEAKRTRPYHYRNFNAAGLITAARLLKYADPSSNVWNTSSIASGATIQSAVTFIMGVDPSKDQASGDAYDGPDVVKAEIYPNIAALASTYGDPEGKYLAFLQNSGFPYNQDAFFVWDQPLGGSSASSNGGVNSANGVASGSSVPSATNSAAAAATSNPTGSSKSASSNSASDNTTNPSNSNNAGANHNSDSRSQQAASAADTGPGAEKSG